MSRDQWVMVLSFAAGVVGLASQFLTLSDDWVRLLGFAVASINLALTTFFGVQVYAGHKASQIKS